MQSFPIILSLEDNIEHERKDAGETTKQNNNAYAQNEQYQSSSPTPTSKTERKGTLEVDNIRVRFVSNTNMQDLKKA